MPNLMVNNLEELKTTTNYKFSGTKLSELGASEYTLVTIVLDKSTSLSGFEKDLEKMLETAIKSCEKSPRSENLLIRVVFFNQAEEEIHGFKLLSEIDYNDYKVTISGITALFDATFHSIEATRDYGKILFDQDYFANAIVFIITDGMDNNSTFQPNSIKDLISDIRKNEELESVATVLIGMTSDSIVNRYLSDFRTRAELNEYIDMGEVTPGKLAKLAGYISHSISSTSQALGSGGPSQNLSKSESLKF